MIKQHCIDKLFGIKDLQVVTKLYATAFVQNVYGYHFIFGVADEDEVIKLDSEILPGTTTMDPDKTKT